MLAGAVLTVTGCSQGPDDLRGDVPNTGVAATVQVNLPNDSQQARIVATVYKNAVPQPLVGGDVLQVRTDQSLVTLHALENLSGHYSGDLFVDHSDTTVDLAVNYDQQASAEDRWFASDDLLVNPGPGSLVGYAVNSMQFPQPLFLASPAGGASYPTRSDSVIVNWAPVNEGDQVRLTAAVACLSGGQTYRYGLTHNIGIEGVDADAAGSYSLAMSELVNVAPLVVTLNNVLEYISLFVTAVSFGLAPESLVNGGNLITSFGSIQHCDIDLTLFREHDNPLPATFSGGYAITSRSDSVRIQYAPE